MGCLGRATPPRVAASCSLNKFANELLCFFVKGFSDVILYLCLRKKSYSA
jgi:hypothetical protein